MTPEEKMIKELVRLAEEKLGQSLDPLVIEGCQNSSLMMLEAIYSSIYFADTPEKLHDWVEEMKAFRR